MAKKNPTVLRIKKTNNWNSRYFEKKNTELSYYTIKDIEIRNFTEKYFENNDFIVHKCSAFHLNKALHIHLSYYNTFNSMALTDGLNKKQNIKIIKNRIDNKSFQYFYNNRLNNYKQAKTFKNFKKSKLFLNGKKIKKKKLILNRTKNLKHYKNYKLIKNFNTFKNIEVNSFLENYIESLTQFTNRDLNIFLILNQLNKNIKQKIYIKDFKKLKKKILQLRKYNQNKFFKKGVNTLFLSALNEKSANLISKFISKEIKTFKRLNFFLKFIKSVLSIFIKSNFSKIQGVKIMLKGRITKNPRARSKVICIGNNMPILTMNKDIDYSETIAFTSNGTIGVKVWVCPFSVIK